MVERIGNEEGVEFGGRAPEADAILVAQADTASTGQPAPDPQVAALDARVVIEVEQGGILRLPANASVDLPQVNGADLEFVQPDGTIIVVPNGAVQGLTIFIGEVEIPPQTVAALFEANGIETAAGPAGAGARSSGGNFEVPVGGSVGDAFNIGDLLPPTELAFTSPEFRELYPANNRPSLRLADFDIRLSEEGLALGLADGLPLGLDTTDDSYFVINLGASDPDGDPLTFTLGLPNVALTSGGLPVVWTGVGTNHLIGRVGNETVIDITVGGRTGIVLIQLLKPVDHPDGSSEDLITLGVRVTVSDGRGGTASAMLNIGIEDDSPIASHLVAAPLFQDEAHNVGNVEAGATAHTVSGGPGSLFQAGADGFGSLVLQGPDMFVIPVGGDGVAGTPVVVVWTRTEVGGNIVLTGTAAGFPDPVAVLTVSPDGAYTYVQNAPVVSSNPAFNDAEETDTFIFRFTVTDGDKDSANGSLMVRINDDTPIAHDVVAAPLLQDEAHGGNVEGGLSDNSAKGGAGSLFKAGADGLGSLTLNGPEMSVIPVDANGVAGAPVQVVWTQSPNGADIVLTGIAAGFSGPVAVLTVHPDGSYTYVQHAPVHSSNPAFNGAEETDNFIFRFTVIDGDEDSTSGSLTIQINDDTPVLSGAEPLRLKVAEDDILTHLSQGTSPNDGSADGSTTGDPGQLVGPATAKGSLGALVNFGADGAAQAGGFSLDASKLASLHAQNLSSNNDALDYTIEGNVLKAIAGATSGNGGRVVFTLTLEPNGDFTFRLYDQLDHVKPMNDKSLSIDFGGVIKATDGDGDSIGLDGKVIVDVTDDVPAAFLKATGATVTHDESAGLQFLSANDVPGGLLVRAPFAALETEKGLAALGYAANLAPSIVYGAVSGADGAGTVSLSLVLAGDGTTALHTTAGQPIVLTTTADGLVLGLAGAGGPVAFAISLSATGHITVAQYLPLQHPVGGASHNEAITLEGLINVELSVTDADNDNVTHVVKIGDAIRFSDDGPTLRNFKLSGQAVVHNETRGVQDDTDSSADHASLFTGFTAGNDPHVPGAGAIGYATRAGDDLFTISENFGTDGKMGATGRTFTFELGNTLTNLTTSEGNAIVLERLANGIVIGKVQGGEFDGKAAFAIHIDAATGSITLAQYLSLQHPTGGASHDETVFLSGDNLKVTLTLTDGDGDTTSKTIPLNEVIGFQDDGPSVQVTARTDSSVTHDESPMPQNSLWNLLGPSGDRNDDDVGVLESIFKVAQLFGAVPNKGDDPDLSAAEKLFFHGAIGYAQSDKPLVSYSANFGADGRAASGAVKYSLESPNPASGLKTTAGYDIVLKLVGNVIVGEVADGPDKGKAAIAIHVDPETGKVTTAQWLSLEHGTNPSQHDDAVHLAPGSVSITVTVEDRDGDTASNSADVSSQIRFEDDGPSLDRFALKSDANIVHDETPGLQGDDTSADVSGLFSSISAPAMGYAAVAGSSLFNISASFGSDGPQGTTGYTFKLSVGQASTALKTIAGETIHLYEQGGLIVGRVGGSTGQVAFAIHIDAATGNVTLAQYVPLRHNLNGHDSNDAIFLAANNVKVTLTVTDGDSDTVTSKPVSIGDKIGFRDDGPSAIVDQSVELQVLTVDESNGTGSGTDGQLEASASFAANFGSVINYGADGPGLVSYALKLDGSDIGSGLYAVDPTKTDGKGVEIVLSQSSGVITGSANGVDYFTISVDGQGKVTFKLTGAAPVWHENTGDHDDASVLNVAEGKLLLTQTVTDADHDSDTASIDIGAKGVFRVEDDGPSLSLAAPAAINDSLFFDNFVLNGNAWGQGSGTASGTAGNWTISDADSSQGTGPIELQRVGDGYLGMHSSTNGYLVDLNASNKNIAISQVVNGLSDGQIYSLTFEAGSVIGSGDSVEVWFGGDLIATITSTEAKVMKSYTFEIVGGGDAAGNTLMFKEVGSVLDNHGTYLANVRVSNLIVIDETAGVDADSSDTDDLAVAALFNALDGRLGVDDATAHYAKGTTPVVNAQVSYGADGPAAGGGLEYALQVTNGTSGLKTTQGEHPITLVSDPSGLVLGVYMDGGVEKVAFALHIGAEGIVSIAQYTALWHDDTTSHDEGAFLAAGSVSVTVAATDGDGDTVTQTADISHVIRFEDDGPTAAGAVSGTIKEGDISQEAGEPVWTLVDFSDGVQNQPFVFPAGSGLVANGTLRSHGHFETAYGAANQAIVISAADNNNPFLFGGLKVGVAGSNKTMVVEISGYDADGNFVATVTVTVPGPTPDGVALTTLLTSPHLLDGKELGRLEIKSLEPDTWVQIDDLQIGHGGAGGDVIPAQVELDIAALAQFGADGQHKDGGFQIRPLAETAFGSHTSDGDQVFVKAQGGVLTGYTDDNAKLFTLEIIDGKAVFRLYGEFDHNIGQDTLIDLDLGGFIFAVDGDGDGVPLNPGALVIKVEDKNDVPVVTINADGVGDSVNESGLPGGTAAGSGHTATGSFTLSDPDGLGDLQTVTIAGQTVSIGSLDGHVFSTPLGTLKIDTYDQTSGVATYTYTLTTVTTDIAGVAETDSFVLTVSDGTLSSASATITIEIVDDVPTATAPVEEKTIAESGLPMVQVADESLNIKWGADKAGSHLEFATTEITDSANGKLSSGGVELAYKIMQADGSTSPLDEKLIAYLKGTDSDEPKNWVFSVNLVWNSPSYQFVLFKPLDHLEGNHEVLAIKFSVNAVDGDGDKILREFTVKINDSTPIASAGSVSGEEDTVIQGSLAGNVVAGSDGLAVSGAFAIAEGPAHGTVALDAETGAYTYTPNANFNGDDSFTFTVKDADGDVSQPATVAITVNPVNDAPTLDTIEPILYEDTAAADTFGNTSGKLVGEDVDGDTLSYGIDGGMKTDYSDGGKTFDISKTGLYGTLYVDSKTGDFLHVPNGAAIEALDSDTSETFMVTVNDGQGASATRPLVIDITAVPEAPVGPALPTPQDSAAQTNILYNEIKIPIAAILAKDGVLGTGVSLVLVSGATLGGHFLVLPGAAAGTSVDIVYKLTDGTTTTSEATFTVSRVAQFLQGDNNSNFLIMRDSGETANGNGGNDILIKAGNTLNGNDGDDYLFGTGGDNTLNGGDGNDYIVGYGGKNTLSGGNGKDYLIGYGGENILTGGDDDDILFASPNAGHTSKLDGGTGNDTLHSGHVSGATTLTGGSGADTFVFHDFSVASWNGGATNTITDYVIGDGDVIDLRELFDNLPTTENASAYVEYVKNEGNNVLRVDLDGAGGAHSFQNLAIIKFGSGAASHDISVMLDDDTTITLTMI